MKIYLAILLLTLCINSTSQVRIEDSSYMKVENKLIIKGKEISLLNNYSIEIQNDKKEFVFAPLKQQFVDLKLLYKSKSKWFVITFIKKNEFKLQITLYSDQFLSKDHSIWNWIVTGVVNQEEGNLLIEFIESEIELDIPVKCESLR